MAAEAFFTRLSNDVLEATEKIAESMEDGLGILFAGGSKEQAPTPAMPQPGAADDFTVTDDEFLSAEELAQESPLNGIAEGVLGGILGQQASHDSILSQFQAFRHAITWSEPFILSLIAFQVVMLILSVYVSRPNAGLPPQLGLMLFIAVLVRSTEYLNQYASVHWQEFATQNYFDPSGLFLSIMLCGPLLVDAFIMLFRLLREASTLLVQVKRNEIKTKMKAQSKKKKTQ